MSRILLSLSGLLVALLPMAMPSEGAPASDSTGALHQPILTLITIPENASVLLTGTSRLQGTTPLDLPSTTTGRHTVLLEGSEFARTHGVIYIPPRGEVPAVLSESPGVSTALLLRGLVNFPGVPDLMTARRGRGAALAAGGLAATFMVIHSQLWYRDRLDEVGDYAADRAKDEKAYRDAWAIYGAATLGLSAIDYWTRARFSLHEATPDHLTLDVPHVSRAGAVWRAVLCPGAGQEFGNHRTRSVVWLGGVLLFGAGYVVADYKVHRDETDVKWAAIEVDSAGPSEAYQKQLDLEQQERSLQASKDIRTGAAIFTAGWYALSIIDAVIMPLTPPKQKAKKVASVTPLVTPQSAGMLVTYRF